MQKTLTFLGFIALFIFQLSAQTASPYRLTMGKDVTISVGGIGLAGTTYFLEKKIKPLTETQISALNRDNINGFDRIAARQWHTGAAKVSDVLLSSSMVLPFTLLASSNIRQDYKTALIIGAETFVLNYGLTNLAKISFQRTRPFVYNPDAPLSKKMEHDARLSFFSGHTSTVASMSFMAAQMYSDYHPHSKANPYVWAAAAVLPTITACLRVRAGKHFPTDVITGYVVGAAVGMLVPRLHRIK
jgi:membrane-associated phospholipid phosphatase